MRQRSRLRINVGNLLELVGVVCVVYGTARLAGLAWAIVVLGVSLVAAAELVYDAHTWRIPLPLKPQPRRWLLEQRQALEQHRERRVVLKAIARQQALDKR